MVSQFIFRLPLRSSAGDLQFRPDSLPGFHGVSYLDSLNGNSRFQLSPLRTIICQRPSRYKLKSPRARGVETGGERREAHFWIAPAPHAQIAPKWCQMGWGAHFQIALSPIPSTRPTSNSPRLFHPPSQKATICFGGFRRTLWGVTSAQLHNPIDTLEKSLGSNPAQ